MVLKDISPVKLNPHREHTKVNVKSSCVAAPIAGSSPQWSECMPRTGRQAPRHRCPGTAAPPVLGAQPACLSLCPQGPGSEVGWTHRCGADDLLTSASEMLQPCQPLCLKSGTEDQCSPTTVTTLGHRRPSQASLWAEAGPSASQPKCTDSPATHPYFSAQRAPSSQNLEVVLFLATWHGLATMWIFQHVFRNEPDGQCDLHRDDFLGCPQG